jgi:hypothetical protein
MRASSLLLLALLAPACSGGGAVPPHTTGTGGGGGQTSSGTQSATGGAGGAPASPLPGALGALPIVDEPDGDCFAEVGWATESLLPDAPLPPAFDHLEPAGDTWLATGADAGGFLLFEEGGAGRFVTLAERANTAASTGARVFAAGISGGLVQLAEYDAAGVAASLDYVPDAADGERLAVGSAGPTALVVWEKCGEVRARAHDGAHGDAMVPPFTLAAGVIGSTLRTSIAPAPQGFAVAVSARGAGTAVLTTLTFVTPEAIAGLPVVVASSERAYGVVRLARAGDGYVLLLQGEEDPPSVFVLPLDAAGRAAPPAHRLVGAARGWDLAAQGDRLAVVATRADGRTAFRPLTAQGAAAGPWVCLGGEGPAGLAPLPSQAGFRLVARSAGGEAFTASVDPLGQSAP